MRLTLINNETPYQIKGETRVICKLNTLSFTVLYKNTQEMEEEMKNLRKIGVINFLPNLEHSFLDFTIPEGLGFIIKED